MKKEKDRRNHYLTAGFNEEEYRSILKAAKEAKKKKSVFLRETLLSRLTDSKMVTS
jgi:hypothetical protein